MTELVSLGRDGAVARLTLQRPEVLNALSFETLAQLSAHVAALAGDSAVRVVILSGAGGRAFSAGADLKERAGFDEAATRAFVQRIGEVFCEVAALPQPTIAAIEGAAFGGGLELALACDLRVASRGSRMGLTETSLAIIPGAGGTQRLPALVGLGRAKELIFTARRLDAEEAAALGLVDRLAEPGAALATASALALQISANGPLAVQAAKAALDLAAGGLPLSQRLLAERELYLQRVLPSRDRLEALAAFREKRPPQFEGR